MKITLPDTESAIREFIPLQVSHFILPSQHDGGEVKSTLN